MHLTFSDKERQMKLRAIYDHESQVFGPEFLGIISQINRSALELKNRLGIVDASIVERSAEILNTVLYDSVELSFWIYVIELKRYIGWLFDHSINVALISLFIASRMNYDSKLMSHIALGGFLHDIGKISIPKEIILKPGKLDKNEMTLMQNHCRTGYSMVSNLGLSQESLNIILHHHERMDGSGYPFGLTGDKLSDGAKIAMIADSLDAMTSPRPYQQIKTASEAITDLFNYKNAYCNELLSILPSFFCKK